MSRVKKSIDVDVPVGTAYNQWTQFESFPHFMHNVVSVTQRDTDLLHWEAKAGTAHREWDARITEQRPDEVIAWTAVDGTENAGRVTFEPLGGDTTRIDLELDVTEEHWTDKIADTLGVLHTIVETDLKRFKEFIEDRGSGGETGSWRGVVPTGPAGGFDEDLSPPADPLGPGSGSGVDLVDPTAPSHPGTPLGTDVVGDRQPGQPGPAPRAPE